MSISVPITVRRPVPLSPTPVPRPLSSDSMQIMKNKNRKLVKAVQENKLASFFSFFFDDHITVDFF